MTGMGMEIESGQIRINSNIFVDLDLTRQTWSQLKFIRSITEEAEPGAVLQRLYSRLHEARPFFHAMVFDYMQSTNEGKAEFRERLSGLVSEEIGRILELTEAYKAGIAPPDVRADGGKRVVAIRESRASRSAPEF